ncbi:MAG TPA: PASTA domain-containing protein [Thermoleophilaceae bacterium]|jgi:hypothetical protein
MAISLRNALLAAAAVLALLPSGAAAEVATFGSDLSAPADSIEPYGAIHPAYGGSWYGADTAFWNTTLASGGRVTAPADGQIVEVRAKGVALRNPSNPPDQRALVHFQVLHPQPDGTVKVDLTSGGVDWPIGGDPQQVTTYRPVNLCIHAGDYVDLNTWGGHEWRWGTFGGIPMQVFGSVGRSTFAWYEKDNGTNNGNYLRGAARPGVELLLQAKLATGPDATDLCPGGYEQHVFRGLDVVDDQVATVRTRTRTVKVRASCHGENYGACKGELVMSATVGDQKVELGRASFDVPHMYTTNVELALSPDVVRAVQTARGLAATVVAEAHDDPAADSRAQPGVPVQSRTTRGRLTLKPDKLLPRCTVPQVKGKTLAAARRSLAKAGCPVGRVTRAKGSKRGRVINQKPNRGSALDAGAKVALVVAR